MTIKIKNISEQTKTWGGLEYPPAYTYSTQSLDDVRRYGFDDTFLADLLGGLAEVYDETDLLSGYSKIVSILQNGKVISPTDDEHKPYVNISMTSIDGMYSPHSLDFSTAKNKSLYNRHHDGAGIDDGTDAGDAWLEFFDENNEAIVQDAYESDGEYQSRITAACVKTVLSWEASTTFDISGAYLYIANKPLERAYLWVVAAPDIPAAYGGSKVFMGRGMNLQMMQPTVNHYFDAKTSKTVTHDPVYHSGKIACVIKHAVGEQIGIQLIYIVYEV